MLNIIERIQKNEHHLSATHRKIGNYILAQYSSVAFCTLSDLAEKIGVSTTSIIRFSREIGYSGYSEMQGDIQKNVIEKVALPKRFKTHPVKGNHKFISTLQNDISNLEQTIKIMPAETLETVVQAILSADTVYIIGLRTSFSLAHLFSIMLGQIRCNVRLIQGVGDTFPEEIMNIRPGDLCIGFVFPRYFSTTINVLKAVRNAGAAVAIISNQSFLPVKQYADYILPCYIDGIAYKDSFVAPLSLINYLTMEVAARERVTSYENLQKVERLFNEISYFGRSR